jgi:hypothetical protein
MGPHNNRKNGGFLLGRVLPSGTSEYKRKVPVIATKSHFLIDLRAIGTVSSCFLQEISARFITYPLCKVAGDLGFACPYNDREGAVQLMGEWLTS